MTTALALVAMEVKKIKNKKTCSVYLYKELEF